MQILWTIGNIVKFTSNATSMWIPLPLAESIVYLYDSISSFRLVDIDNNPLLAIDDSLPVLSAGAGNFIINSVPDAPPQFSLSAVPGGFLVS